jgi:protein phosphatase
MDATTIKCSNPSCQTPNSLSDKFCKKCRTPLIKRYLRAVGDWLGVFRVGELIGDRYLVGENKILLDTQPGVFPITPEEVPDSILPYLKLLPYRLNVPQVYGYLPSPEERLNLDIWLLEYGNVPTEASGKPKYKDLFPLLTKVWQKADALQQLNWLWQMARLWQPLQNKKVVSSLLDPSLLALDGNFVKIIELKFDGDDVITLPKLGQFWSQWTKTAAPNLAGFLAKLCEQLERDEFSSIDQAIAILETAIAQISRAYESTYQIYTCTDAGPTRDHNEDACYPKTGKTMTRDDRQNALAIVCDGIGGQEGGEIASQLAIDTLVDEIEALTAKGAKDDSQIYSQAIERAICESNDFISKRNDSEQRHDRQRMGTTLVMSLTRDREIYIAHVGDSRVYWIAPESCQQVTVDDDLASREVRLGYLLYREAIQYPNAGALIQALGMSASASLHPTVQNFIVDRDCVFFLCSDGLSDFDRVEQYWDSEIAPIISGDRDVATAGDRLLEIANRRNGHDNVTIALVRCQVKAKANAATLAIVYPETDLNEPSAPLPEKETIREEALEAPTFIQARTQIQTAAPTQPPPERSSWWLPLLLSLLGFSVFAGACYLWWTKTIAPGTSEPAIEVPTTSSTPEKPSTNPPPNATPQPDSASPRLKINEVLRLSKAIALQNSPTQETPLVQIAQNTVVQVTQTDYSDWIKLKVCPSPPKERSRTNPSSNNAISSSAPKEGWIALKTLQESSVSLSDRPEAACSP